MKKYRIIALLGCVLPIAGFHSNKQPIIVVSAGYGPEDGKGKICDWLTQDSDVCVRAQGINISGHRVVIDNKEYVLYHIPVGIISPHIICYLTAGMIIDPGSFFKEVADLENKGISVKKRIKVSTGAHLLMPYHKIIDQLSEKRDFKRSGGGVRQGGLGQPHLPGLQGIRDG